MRDFLDGITDPHCEAIKLQILASPIYQVNIKIEEEAVPIVAARINVVEGEVVVVAVIWPEIIVHKNGRHSHLKKE